jgi:hypothetical protein
MRRGFRSDQVAAVYDEALRQRWQIPDFQPGSGHMFLRCPKRGCSFLVAFSTTGRYHHHELNNQVALMRRHGFVWRGRGGQHAAPKLNRNRMEKQA